MKKNKIYAYVMSSGLVFLTTAFGEFVKRRLEPTNISMFYLLIVVIAAIRWGQGPAVVTSILSVLCFDFFLIPPYLTFTVAHIQYVFTLIGFLVVGLVVSTFASRIREQIAQRHREKLQSALLSSISHDLKTPLVSITGTVTALLNKRFNLDDRQREALLRTAAEESNRLNRVVNNLLDMTRMEAGALQIRRKYCDLKDLIGACLQQLKDTIGSRQVKTDIPKDLPEVKVDFPFMLKAFLNIIDNSLKYSPDDSAIEIRATGFQDKVVIQIQDHGCGIPMESLSKIFEKFYRTETSANIPGTGLGLCISKGIIEAHGGQIKVESALGKGSVFAVELPLNN